MKFLLILASAVMLTSAEDSSGGYSYDVRTSPGRQGALIRPSIPAFSQPIQHQNGAVHHQNTGAEHRPFAPALSRHIVQQLQQIEHQQHSHVFSASPAVTRPSPGVQRPIQPQQIYQQAHLTRPTVGFSQVQHQQQQHSSGVVSQDISGHFQSGPTFAPHTQEPSLFSVSPAISHHENPNFAAAPALTRPAPVAHAVSQDSPHLNNNGLRSGSEGLEEDSYVRPPNTPIGPYYSGPTPAPIIRKHVSVHFAADEPQEQQSRPALPPPAQEKHYKILFIKAPTYQSIQAQDIPQFAPPPEQKTLVYVLLKKPESLHQQVALATPAPTKPSKPEVFFIRYKTPEGPTTAPIYGPPDGASGNPIGESSDVAA